MVRQKKDGTWVVELWDPTTKTKTHIRARDYSMASPRNAREAYRLEDAAEKARAEGRREMTADKFTETWTERYPRSESTDKHNAERVSKFGKDFTGRSLRSITPTEARDWALANKARVPAVRAMLNDAKGERLVEHNQFAKLGLSRSRGRADITILTEDELDELVAAARDTHEGEFGREFGALIEWAAYTCMRPGEVFDAKYPNLTGDLYDVDGQWHSKLGKRTEAKHGSEGLIYVPDKAREALADVRPRRIDDPLIFHSKTGRRLTAGTLFYAWDPVRAAFGRPEMDFYDLRHRGASYMLNDLHIEPWLIAEQLRHKDGGKLVLELYGHPDRLKALNRIRDAYQKAGGQKVVSLDERRADAR